MRDPRAKCDCGHPDLRHLGFRGRFGKWCFLNGYYCLKCGSAYIVKDYEKAKAP